MKLVKLNNIIRLKIKKKNLLLESGDDLSNQSSLHAIRLDHDVSTLHFVGVCALNLCFVKKKKKFFVAAADRSFCVVRNKTDHDINTVYAHDKRKPENKRIFDDNGII